ncbi:uncharacterized protein MKK02DRAFT_29583 [Dioszegia hungarica]|uniref:Uncharacterized protein n=1 Tax=Dioszegia hungarica TaxID=4972 RepID=A0AA38HHG3_9TREE|nr:uncharacterized protein MKK02DRAFT_29583 [Dioszegia hungarica]KAI9639544.1 hypothetical protein MKK02DRAFT_29583 [Dioszegia hungarica]
MDLVTDIQMAGYRFQHACDKVDRERNLAKEREAKAAQILADATAREAEKLSIIQRAEAAELALGQAVMKQERIITELEKAKAEIEKLKEEAETRKRKGGDDEAAEVNDKAGGMQASGSKKARSSLDISSVFARHRRIVSPIFMRWRETPDLLGEKLGWQGTAL